MNSFVGASQVPGVQLAPGVLTGIGEALGGAGALIAASDRRLKTNIMPAGKTAGGNNLYTWDWTDEGARIAGNQPGYGVIAQEVNQDAVIVGPHGYLMVDYSRVL